MGQNKILSILLIVIMAIVMTTSAIALPDIPPTCSLNVNSNSVDTTAVLTSTATDSLGNAGMNFIKIYEDGSLKYTKNCYGNKVCTATKVVLHTVPGNHKYTAKCKDNGGNLAISSSKTVQFAGINQAPYITSYTPSSSTTIDEDESIAFSVTATDPDGDALKYSWKVGGIEFSSGSSYNFQRSTSQDTEHVIVSVEVRDPMGYTDIQTWHVYIHDLELQIEVVGETGMDECQTFEYSVNYLESFDMIVGSEWNFGDGTTDSGATVQHVFPEDGTYNVQVEVTEQDGDSDTATFTTIVTDIEPTAIATANATTIIEGESIQFVGDATFPCDKDVISTWEWDFNEDGVTDSTEQNPTHLFTDDGEFDVTLTVTDDDGSVDMTIITITVEDTEPIAACSVIPETIVEGEQVDFSDDSTSYDTITTWEWDFNEDGVTDSTEQNPSHIYTHNNTYTATLTVYDEDGDSDSATCDVEVLNNAPIIDLTATPMSGDEPLTVDFVCEILADTGNEPFEFLIDFGDGSTPASSGTTTNTSFTATYTYETNQTVTATCYVMDIDGDEDSDSETIEVLNNPPVVQLIATPDNGDEPLGVQFDCVVTGGNVNYNYTILFGDLSADETLSDVSSDTFTTTHDYLLNGTYEAMCIVEDIDGDIGSDNATIIVNNVAPVADILLNTTEGYEPLDVLVDCFYTDGNEPVVTTIDFGDGSPIVTSDSAEHTYVQNGTYTVTCTSTDDDGDADSASTNVSVWDTIPVINFTWTPDQASELEDIYFTSTIDVYDTPYTVEWNFGDGVGTSTEENPTYNYSVGGDYEVCLTVTDNDGSVVTVCNNVTVLTNPPVLDLIVLPENGTEPLGVTVYCDIYDGDGPNFDYVIDFGDGTLPASGIAVEPNTNLEVDHTYLQNGTYNVTCTVTDTDFDTVVESASVEVFDSVPIANFTWVPNPSSEGEEVQFTDLSSAYDGIVSWSWDLDGDLTEDSIEQNPVWTYDVEGFYDVTLTVIDGDGSVDTLTLTVEVLNVVPSVILIASPNEGPEALNVTFDCSTTDGNPDFTYELNFDYMGETNTTTTTSTDYSTWFEYVNDGVYNVSCTVTDSDGDVGMDWALVNVTPYGPNATLTLNETTDYEALTITADCTSIGDVGNEPFTYEINFGDGTIVDNNIAEHTYLQNGTYDVTCTIEDVDGDIDSDTQAVTVLDTVPVVSFTYIPLLIEEGDTVYFDSTMSAYDGISDFVWNFESLGTSTDEDPNVTFALEGTYNVSLTVTDGDGSVVTVWEEIVVDNNALIATLEANATLAPENTEIEFNCSVLGGNAPYTYLVDFGNGVTSSNPLSTYVYTVPGTYEANCTITDDDGDWDSDFIIITIEDNAPEVVLSAVPTDGPEGTSVHFECLVTGGDDPITTVLNFGDGSVPLIDTLSADHVYTTEGLYNATCSATDSDLDVGIDSVDINISNNAPNVDLIVIPQMGDEPLYVEYNCTIGGGNAPYIYNILIENDTTVLANLVDTMPVGMFNFTNPGDYNITCTVSDNDGDVDSETEIVHVWNNAPSVDLVVVPTTGTEGTNFSFVCNVVNGNAPFNYEIDFGEGIPVSTETGYHIYATEGLYNASCTVIDNDGDIGIDWEIVNVSNAAPVVNVITNTTSGNEELTIDYNCTVAGGNEPYTYDLDFGDGIVLTATSPIGVHTYPWVSQPDLMDSYVLTCTVTDADLDSSSDFADISVYNFVPNPAFVADDSSITEGDNVHFDCTSTEGNEPLTTIIDFGDGSTPVNTESATHTYTLEGEYNATCTVTDVDGDITVNQTEISVSNNPPIVNMWTNTTSGNERLTVEYDCVVGGGNEPFNYEIDFGDGTVLTATTPSGNHTYDWVYSPDTMITYTMTCNVTDVDGDLGTDIADIDVYNFPPIASLTADDYLITEGEDVYFECGAVNGNEPVTYTLDFGDGSPSVTDTMQIAVTHTYALEDVVNVTCTTVDVDTDSDIAWAEVTITNNAPIVNVDTNVTASLEPMSVEYNCTVGGGNEPYTYDVIVSDDTNTVVGTSTTSVGVFDLLTPGEYNITCTVTDTDGDIGSDITTVEVIDNVPMVTLTAVPSSGIEGDIIDFECSVTGGNAPLDYALNFGDGSAIVTSTDANIIVSHNYTLEGNYNATCVVVDGDGDIGRAEVIVPIGNNVPVVNLVPNVTSGMEALTVEFNCTLVGSGNAPFTYFMDLGDGTTTTNSYYVHTYATNDTYTTSCTITDVDGDVSVPDQEIITVFDSEPNANFTYLPVSPVEGDIISFTDLSTAYDGVVAWAWNFDDGNTSTVANPTHTYFIEGNYLVVLTVTDSDGSTESHIEWVHVGNNAPNATLSVVPVSGTEPQMVMVDCSATGGNAPLNYSLYLGDGSYSTSTSPILGVTHTYTQNGSYPVSCIVEDVDGDVDVATEAVVVDDTLPTADFTFLPANPSAGEQVNFTDLSTAYDGITGWAWDLNGDGIIDSTTKNTSMVYTSPGLYVVNLTVTDSDGSTDWTIRSVLVNISIASPIIFGVSVDVTDTTANVSWATDQSADSLVEYGLTTSLGSTVSDGTMVFNHLSELTGLLPNTTYYYNITSCNMFTQCTTEGPYNFTTAVTPDTTAPAPVTGLGETSVGDSWIEWSWTNPIDADFDHVEIWVNGTWYNNVTASTYNVTGLVSDTTYEVEIITVDTSDNRNTPGVTDLATTLTSPIIDTTAPTVTLLAPITGAIENIENVTVQWSVTDDISLNMSCEMYSNTSGIWAQDTTSLGFDVPNSTTQTFDYNNLVDGMYEWNVRCNDGSNYAFASANFTFEVNTTAADTTPPGPVTALVDSSVGQDWIEWNWTNPMDADFDHVEVFLNGTWIVNVSANTINVTGLLPNTTYEVVLVTVDTTGNRNTPGVSDTASTNPVDTTPALSINVNPPTGTVSTIFDFNATVIGGEGTLTYDWDFGDLSGSSVLEDPSYTYAVDAVYTVGCNVTDVDGDWDYQTLILTVGSSSVSNIAVESITQSKVSSTTYLDDLINVSAVVNNTGGTTETFDLELWVNGVLENSTTITMNPGNVNTVTLSYVADAEGVDVLEMNADITDSNTLDNSQTTSMRVWSVDDILSNSTRTVFLSTAVIPLGVAFTVSMPIQGDYAGIDLYDLPVELWYNTSAFTVDSLTPVIQYVDLPGTNPYYVAQWTVTPIQSGFNDFSVIMGNDELVETDFVQATIQVL